LSTLNKEEIDKIAPKYLLEHHLLTKRFQGTIQQIVAAFHLLVDGKIVETNYKLSGEIVAVQLYKKNRIADFSLGLGEPSLEELSLRQLLSAQIMQISTLTFYPFESLESRQITD
jgi:hypothetical protein